ncbi:MAG: prephenate dehydratase [Candidatus Margulisbacteria bacterium]|nr:prephenate dehydratase [Candidatus Margulisiibacteriota bacterium]
MSIRFACLGPAGTFSDQAARLYLALKKEKADVVYLPTIDDVLISIEENKNDQAIVPVENLVEGSINETLDFLAKSNKISIIGELDMNIHHNLIGLPGTKLKDIKTVVSLAQPIAQCRKFLKTALPGANIEYTQSTAAATQLVAEKKDKTIAAIGSDYNLKQLGLAVLQSNISDINNNQTRFLIIDNKPLLEKGTKVSIVFATDRDVPGGLYRILQEFAQRNINLTKIESRPTKDYLGTYLFFLDFQGHLLQNEVREALDNIRKKTTFFKILGVYEVVSEC